MAEEIYEDHPVFFVNNSGELEFCGEICLPTGNNIPKRIIINVNNQQKEYVLSKRRNKT